MTVKRMANYFAIQGGFRVVIFILRVKVLSQNRTDAVKTIKAMIGPTEAKPDCQCCTLFSHIDNDDELILIEKWHSQESMEDHIRSDEFRNVLAFMDLAILQPMVVFFTVSSIEGMALIERLRC